MRALSQKCSRRGKNREGGNKGTTVIYAAFKCITCPLLLSGPWQGRRLKVIRRAAKEEFLCALAVPICTVCAPR